MKKRVFSLLLALVMMFSMIPTSVFAVGTGTEQDPYQVGDTVTNDGSAEPEGVKAENTHWTRTADVAAVQTTVCQTEEHDHAAAGCAAAYETVQCLLEGHPAEGETGFAHDDGTVCTYDAENALWLTNVEAGYLCDIEAHTHTVEGGCITEVPGYTVWTLVADTTSAPKGLPAMAPAPLSEDDEGRLPIHFFLASPGNITNPNGTYTNYYVPLNDKDNAAWTVPNIKKDDAWDTMYSQNGIRNVSDEDIIRQYIGSWPEGSEAAFKDFGSVRIGGTTYYDTNYEIKWVSIMCRDNDHSSYGMRCNQSSYDGEHIHVDGLLVEKILPGDMEVYKAIPSAVNTETTFQFTLQKMIQPNLTSAPTSADAIDTSFAAMTLTASISAGQTSAQIVGGDEISFGYYKLTENDSTAWKNDGIVLTDSRGRTQTVDTDTLYICIAPNGTVQYSTNVSGSYTTMKRVQVQNARKDVTITYQWKVLDESGFYTELPAGAPAEPASSNQSYGSRYTYDTTYVDGTSFGDYETGLLYTFRGWDVYTHDSAFTVDTSAVGNTALDDGDANASNNQTIPMTADTYINGYWVVSKMPPADAHIAVKKIFKLDDQDVTATLENTAIAAAKGVWFRVNPGIDLDGDGLSQLDIDYPMIQADKSGEYKLPVYQYATPFTFTEYGADVPGFTRETKIEVTGENAELIKNEGVYAEVKLDPVYQDEKGHLGTIIYTNSYTKNIGDDVEEYPALTLVKRATDTGNLQENAEFTLYSDIDCTEPIATFTTNEDGIAVIDFASITTKANTYYLKETAAPADYLVNDEVYTLTLTSATEEELRGNEFVMVTTYALSVTVPVDSSAEAVQSAANAQKYSLNVFNDPILGQLTVKKDATGLDEADEALLEAAVTIHGPITRNAQGYITGLGNEYSLFLNNENEWTSVQTQLPIGEYLIHENMASVHGYTWDMNAVDYGALETEVYNNITSGVFEITADNTDIEVEITNTYKKWESGDFYIYKTDPNGAHLSGAAFQLYSDEDCTVAVTDSDVTTNAVTGANGYAWFSGYTVPAEDTDGVVTYYLKETEAPAGHYLSNTIYKVDIKAVTDSAGTTTFEPRILVKLNGKWEDAEGFSKTSDILNVVNTPVKGQITITKNMISAPADLTSVTFYLSGPNHYGKTVALTKNNGWTATLNDLPLGTYTIIEQKADAPGYDLVTTYEVNGIETADKATVVLSETNPGKTAMDTVFAGEAEITNIYTIRETSIEHLTSLTVQKVGEDGTTPLAGAEFTLVRDRDGHTVSYTTNAEGKAYFSFLSGTIANGQIEEGKYTLTETKAPAGYATSDTVWKITVKEDNNEVTIKLNEQTNIFENIWDWIIGGITDGTTEYTYADDVLTVKNVELADLTISKKFVGVTTIPDGSTIEVAVMDSEGRLVQEVELMASNNWTVKLEDLPAATYTVREVSPSLHGYTWKSAVFGVTVDGQTENGIAVGNSAVQIEVKNSDDVKVDITNTYTVWEAADFYVLKTTEDGDTPLAGAQFMLKDAAGKNVTAQYLHDDSEYHTSNGNITGSGGILHFQGFVVDEGETATFTLVEEKAPNNYYVNENSYTIVISHTDEGYDVTVEENDDKASFNHGNDVLTVINEEILADLVIKKTFSDESDLIPSSVKVDVTGPNGYSETVTLGTRNDYEVTLENLSLGEYFVKEQDASQKGYTLTVRYNNQIAEQATVKLTEANDNDAAVVNIQNTYLKDIHNPAYVTVKKVDAESGQPLEGAVFGLYDNTNTLVGEAKTTDDDGIVTFGPFSSAAEYTLKEISAPKNYHTSNETWSVKVELKNGEPTVVEVAQNKQNIFDWIAGIFGNQTSATWENNVLTVPNVIKTGNLKVTKTVYDRNELYKDAEYTFTLDCSDDTFDETFTLKAGKEFTVENIPWGTTYTLTENTEDAAFISSIADGVNGTIQNETVTYDVTNSYAYTTHNAGLNLVKVDAEDSTKVIKDAGFTLYADEECKTKAVAEVFSDEAGKVNIPVAKAGTYYLKETTTPAGYHPNETVYVVKAEEKAVVKNAGTAEAVTEMQMHITVNGLTGTTSNQIDYTYAIENTAIKHFDVSVQKQWDDGGYHARPASVEAVLLRDGEEFETVELNASNGWKYTWEDLTDEYIWSVDEKATPAEYVKSVTNEEHDWTITNTRTPKPVEITVTKAWNHNGGKNLPESIQVTLYENSKAKETVTLNEENQWTYTWTGLTDVSVWSVDEVEVPEGYTKKVTVDGYNFTITNTRTINPVEVSVTKEWVASAGVVHPESIEAVLYRDGKGFKTVTLSADNEWTYKWTDLTDEYTWNVDEKTVPAGYIKNVSHEGNDFTITNTPVKEGVYEVPTSLTVKKVDADGVTPLANAEFTLKRLGVRNMVIGTVTKTTNADGIAVFDLLSGFVVNGEAIDGRYVLSETKAPEGYVSTDATWTITVEDKDGEIRWELSEDKTVFEGFWDWVIGNVSAGRFKNGILTVKNEKKVGSLTIQKEVTDSKALYAEEEYSFKLDASDNRFDKTFTLKAGEAYTVKNIPWGTTYTLTEKTTGAAYTNVVADGGNGKIWADTTEITVTNTYNYTTHNAGLNLVKVDAEDSTKVIKGAGFTLYADEECKTKAVAEVFSDEAGKVNIPVAKAGTYYLKETTTPAGYHPNETVYVVKAEEKAVVKNAGTAEAVTEMQMHITVNGLTGTTSNQIDYIYAIKNTAFKHIDVSVEKIWYSPNVNHPASVEVTLYRDGIAFDTVKLDASNGWKYVWTGLTDEFVWTVDEPSVPSGYTKEVKDLGGNAFQIINTHEDIPRTGDFTNFGGLAMMGITGVFGFLVTAFFLLVPRKKGKYER